MIPVQPNQDKIFIDARDEIATLFYGDATQPGFSFEVLVRHVDKTQRCHCWDAIKQESDPRCTRCSGSGWLVYDRIYRSVKRKYIGKEELDAAGIYEIDSTLFFFEHSVALTEQDTIIEVATDDRGKMISPVRYIKRHSIKDVELMRGNNGRVEFLKVFASKAE